MFGFLQPRHLQLFNAVLSGELSAVEAQLKKAKVKDVNWQEGHTFHRSSLMLASEMGRADIARLLLAHGANINAVDQGNFTALMFASREGHIDTVKLFLAVPGVNTKIKCQIEKTAIDFAKTSEIRALFLPAPAPTPAPTEEVLSRKNTVPVPPATKLSPAPDAFSSFTVYCHEKPMLNGVYMYMSPQRYVQNNGIYILAKSSVKNTWGIGDKEIFLALASNDTLSPVDSVGWKLLREDTNTYSETSEVSIRLRPNEVIAPGTALAPVQATSAGPAASLVGAFGTASTTASPATKLSPAPNASSSFVDVSDCDDEEYYRRVAEEVLKRKNTVPVPPATKLSPAPDAFSSFTVCCHEKPMLNGVYIYMSPQRYVQNNGIYILAKSSVKNTWGIGDKEIFLALASNDALSPVDSVGWKLLREDTKSYSETSEVSIRHTSNEVPLTPATAPAPAPARTPAPVQATSAGPAAPLVGAFGTASTTAAHTPTAPPAVAPIAALAVRDPWSDFGDSSAIGKLDSFGFPITPKKDTNPFDELDAVFVPTASFPTATEVVAVDSASHKLTLADRAALDSFLQSYTPSVGHALRNAEQLNAVMLKVSAHDRALQTLAGKNKECPSLFWFYPKKRELRNWLKDPLKCLLQDTLMMVVVCPVTLRVVRCGPDGVGWEISSPKAWVKKWGPTIMFSIYVLQAAVLAGRVVGIPLPSLPSASSAANALGLNNDALANGVNDVVSQQKVMDCLSTFSSTAQTVLGEQSQPMKELCAKMQLQQKQQRDQPNKGPATAAEEVTLGADMPTQMFDESYKSIHAYLTSGDNAKLGKLEDQLRGSMERVLAEDGDMEWVSTDAADVYRQKHRLQQDTQPEWGHHRPTTSTALPPPPPAAESWLAVRLQNEGVKVAHVQLCEDKLIDEEGHSEKSFVKMATERFNETYLDRIGITAAGLQHKLIAVHRALVVEYQEAEDPFSSLSPLSPVTPLTPTPDIASFATSETTTALEKKLEALTSQLSELKSSTSGKGSSPVPGQGGSSGGKGGLVLKQRNEASAINPQTEQPYTMDEMVAEILLLRSAVAAQHNDFTTMAAAVQDIEVTLENK